MREILFRGKDNGVLNNQWQFGSVDFTNENFPQIIRYDRFRNKMFIPVDCDTVGQFTGLTDKNGKKIFEGDIVNILGNQDVEEWKNVNYNALIAFLDGGFCAIDGTIEEHGFRRYALARMDFGLEVIGNIHDNPELLGGC